MVNILFCTNSSSRNTTFSLHFKNLCTQHEANEPSVCLHEALSLAAPLAEVQVLCGGDPDSYRVLITDEQSTVTNPRDSSPFFFFSEDLFKPFSNHWVESCKFNQPVQAVEMLSRQGAAGEHIRV